MNALLDKVLTWLGTKHTTVCDLQAAEAKQAGYTATCKCDFWQRAADDFQEKKTVDEARIAWLEAELTRVTAERDFLRYR